MLRLGSCLVWHLVDLHGSWAAKNIILRHHLLRFSAQWRMHIQGRMTAYAERPRAHHLAVMAALHHPSLAIICPRCCYWVSSRRRPQDVRQPKQSDTSGSCRRLSEPWAASHINVAYKATPHSDSNDNNDSLIGWLDDDKYSWTTQFTCPRSDIVVVLNSLVRVKWPVNLHGSNSWAVQLIISNRY